MGSFLHSMPAIQGPSPHRVRHRLLPSTTVPFRPRPRRHRWSSSPVTRLQAYLFMIRRSAQPAGLKLCPWSTPLPHPVPPPSSPHGSPDLVFLCTSHPTVALHSPRYSGRLSTNSWDPQVTRRRPTTQKPMAWSSICIVLSRPPSSPVAPTHLGFINFLGSSSGFVRLQKKASTSQPPKWCMATHSLFQPNSSLKHLFPPTFVAFSKSWENLLKYGLLNAPSGRPTPSNSLSSSTHVFVRTDCHRKPLAKPYTGPYKVLQRRPKAFLLDIRGKHDWTSIDCLKPAFFDDSDLLQYVSPELGAR